MSSAALQYMLRFSLCVLLLFAGGAPALAQQQKAAKQERFVEGVHYQRLAVPQLTVHPSKVEVVEFFRYSCPHCQRFRPIIKAWAKRQSDDVVFTEVPHILKRGLRTRMPTQAYYVTRAFDREDIHDEIFKRHRLPRHSDRPTTLAKMVKLFKEYGIPEKTYRQTIDSFGIIAALGRAETLSRNYDVQGVPCLIVQGKYKISPNRYVSLHRMLKVADHLIDVERKALALDKKEREKALEEQKPAARGA